MRKENINKLLQNYLKELYLSCTPQLLSMVFSLVKNNKKYELDENKYKELCDLEKKHDLKSKNISYYETEGREKSRFRRPEKNKKNGEK